jgi:hypothetical protein
MLRLSSCSSCWPTAPTTPGRKACCCPGAGPGPAVRRASGCSSRSGPRRCASCRRPRACQADAAAPPRRPSACRPGPGRQGGRARAPGAGRLAGRQLDAGAGDRAGRWIVYMGKYPTSTRSAASAPSCARSASPSSRLSNPSWSPACRSAASPPRRTPMRSWNGWPRAACAPPRWCRSGPTRGPAPGAAGHRRQPASPARRTEAGAGVESPAALPLTSRRPHDPEALFRPRRLLVRAAQPCWKPAAPTFEPVLVKLHKGEQNEPEYRAVNPRGQVPVLVDGDAVITQILAIVATSTPSSRAAVPAAASRWRAPRCWRRWPG